MKNKILSLFSRSESEIEMAREREVKMKNNSRETRISLVSDWYYYNQVKVELSESLHWTFTLTLPADLLGFVFALLLILGQMHGLKVL